MVRTGRPSKGITEEGVLTHISANLPPKLAADFRAHSDRTHIRISELIRLAIAEYLENHKDGRP